MQFELEVILIIIVDDLIHNVNSELLTEKKDIFS